MFTHPPRFLAIVFLGMAASIAVLWPCQFNPQSAEAQNAQQKPAVKKDAAEEKTIRALIAQLGDPSFKLREAAANKLTTIGEPALDLLEKTARESTDAEIRNSAGLLVQAISNGLYSQARQFDGHKNGKPVWVTRVVVTPDGRRAISTGSDALRYWDLAGGKQIGSFDNKGIESWGLAISPDGNRVIAGYHDKKVHVFDLTTGKKVASFLGHTASVWGVALLADGKQAISGGDDKTIRVWNLDNGQELRAFKGVDDGVRCMAHWPKEKLLATGHFVEHIQPGTIRIWNIESGQEIRALHGHTGPITSLSFSSDGKMLLSSSGDRTVRLWDVATGQELKCFKGHTDVTECAAFTSDGKRIISGGNIFNPSLRFWDIATGKQIFETEPVAEGFFGVAGVPNSRQCLSGGRDGVVRLWQWKR